MHLIIVKMCRHASTDAPCRQLHHHAILFVHFLCVMRAGRDRSSGAKPVKRRLKERQVGVIAEASVALPAGGLAQQTELDEGLNQLGRRLLRA